MKCAGSRIRPFGSQGPIGDGAATDAYTVRSMEVEVCAYVSFFLLSPCVGPVGVAVAYRIILARLRWSPWGASGGPRAMHSPYMDPLVHDSSMHCELMVVRALRAVPIPCPQAPTSLAPLDLAMAGGAGAATAVKDRANYKAAANPAPITTLGTAFFPVVFADVALTTELFKTV